MPFITIAGENQIALKQGNAQVLNVTEFVLANIAGLVSEPVDRIEALPDPGDIVDTQPVTKSGYVNDNQVVYSLTLDSTIGDYDFNWVGLKDADGVLIAVAYVLPAITKFATSGPVEGNNIIRNFLLQYSGITATTAISAPADTWQIDFTTRLLQIDERERLSNFDIYGQGAFFGNGFAVSLNSGTLYDVAAGIGYVGGVRCEFESDQQIDVPVQPSSIYVDASLQGDINGVSEVVSLTASASLLTDYTDGSGVNHYVAKIADISAGGLVTDIRTEDPYLLKSDTPSQAEAEAGTETKVRAWSALRVKQAIQALVKSATETVKGIAEVATQTETDTGTDDSRIVSPKKLLNGFNVFFSASASYITLPSWLGGFIIQLGYNSLSTGNNNINFLLVFPNNCRAVITQATTTQRYAYVTSPLSLDHFSCTPYDVTNGGNATTNIFWIAVGN